MAGGRVLMIAHHFPPAGGSGSNRALAFARYLPDYGWRPVVVTPDAAWATNRDDSLLAELPRDVREVRTRSFEARAAVSSGVRRAVSGANVRTARVPRAASALRSNLGHIKRFPDAHLGWLPFALAAARRQRYDVAYSSSGPFTSHLIGLLLNRTTGKPWVAELRDGWYRWNRAIFPGYPAWRDALERRLEAAALRGADRVVLVTDRMAEQFRAQYTDLPPWHFAVVSNGYDPRQFEGVCASVNVRKRPGNPCKRWVMVHAGALYYGRSLAAFLDAARAVIATDEEFARDFGLQLIGSLDRVAHGEIERSGLGNHVTVRGQMAHAEAIDAMRAADALLLIANTTPGAEATVPGKLFEYLAVGRPVLAVAPAESSTADVLRQTGGGWLAAAGDPRAIACILQRAYAERATFREAADIASFDRRVLTGELARIFDEVTKDAAHRT
jgi:glycosyltransferase involved in cell wall biosynthesis